MPFSDIPEVPEGLKQTATANPFSIESTGGVYPVFEIGPYTYWALSYIDNRTALAIVVFDSNGQVVKTIERSGARYIYQIERDLANQEIVFIGQSLRTVRVSWAELTSIP